MRLSVAYSILASAFVLGGCQAKYRDVIIPQPQNIEVLKGYCPSSAVPVTDTVASLPPEGYELTISRDGIHISASDAAGAFYALQSLDQLKRAYGRRIPAQKITDAPRFSYRGIHLDVSRNFRDKEFVKKQLLMFSRLKINRFHFHLTDAAGWRMEIKKYPELTSVAAFRPRELYPDWWKAGASDYSPEGSGERYGGYYTQDDLREIVAFADSLHITVIPEIEMFGHSGEVTAVYPWTACGHHSLSVNEDGTVRSPQGDLCVGKEETFRFIEDVLDEVMEIFPSEYIHIGGDEAGKNTWVTCPDCLERMRKEGLAGVDELQSYGIARVEAYLNSHGRQIIGWDEILEGGLAPNAAVMSWRGEEGGRVAAAAGHRVIMTPGNYCYLDKCQDDPATEPAAFGGNLSLEKVYSYDPAPEDMEGREYVYGVQANLWTEYVLSDEHAEHMYYPRAYALAEVAWSDSGNRDYESFRRRALEFNARAASDGYSVFDLSTEKGNREGYSDELRHFAKGCQVEYVTSYYPSYAASGDGAMTDGLIGGWDYRDRWQGWLNRNAVFTVDLGESRNISEMSISFGQWKSAEIVLPVAVVFELSDDGENFSAVARIEHEIDWDELLPVFKEFSWRGEAVTGRYVRVSGCINSDRWGWLFADELVIR